MSLTEIVYGVLIAALMAAVSWLLSAVQQIAEAISNLYRIQAAQRTSSTADDKAPR